jgi:hypothetical protein
MSNLDIRKQLLRISAEREGGATALLGDTSATAFQTQQNFAKDLNLHLLMKSAYFEDNIIYWGGKIGSCLQQI